MGGEAKRQSWLPIIGDIPAYWQVLEFGEVLDGGTRNGIYKKKEFHGRGVKIINMGELFANPRLHNVDMKRVELTHQELSKSAVQVGDLLFARRSLVAEGAGKCSIVCAAEEPTTFESSIIRARPNQAKADSYYLYYLFNSPFGRYSLRTIRRTVAVSGITGTDLLKLEIPVPPLPVQRAIASILGALDDKIELNRRMNATLESLAAAIFKSWFVDFDPVRAKMDGRQPAGMDEATAGLFPSGFQVTSFGTIPAEWTVSRMGDLAGRVAMGPFGSRITRENFVESGVPVIRGNNLTNGFNEEKFVFLTDDKADELKSANAYPGDIVITHRGTLGQAGRIPPNARHPRYVVSQSQMLLQVNAEKTGSRFVYYYLRSPGGQHALLANTSQTGVPAIARPTTSLKAIQLAVPPKQISDAFDALISPAESRIDCNAREANTLAALRDTLLPKLLSGELRVADAERAVEAAV